MYLSFASKDIATAVARLFYYTKKTKHYSVHINCYVHNIIATILIILHAWLLLVTENIISMIAMNNVPSSLT